MCSSGKHVSGQTIKEKERKSKLTDYLTTPQGPKLNFEATDGLISGQNKPILFAPIPMQITLGKCMLWLEKWKNGKKVKILIGTGHCQWLTWSRCCPLNYILMIRSKNYANTACRDMAKITWNITRNYQLGILVVGRHCCLSSAA